MLIGSADPQAAAVDAPTLARLDTEPLTLAGCSVLQVLCEIESSVMCELLPPALHPTLPPAVAWLVYDCPDTPWGRLRLAQTRIECRSGTRPRGFLVSAVCDNDDAAEALASRWGYRVRHGSVELRRSYDEVVCRVLDGERPVLETGLRDPLPLGPGDIQFPAGMHPAHTSRGFRLIQCDPAHSDHDAQRGEPRLGCFDAAAWGEPRIKPVYPVSGAFCVADITLPKLRFACLPDQLAFAGTEKL